MANKLSTYESLRRARSLIACSGLFRNAAELTWALFAEQAT